MKLSELSKIAKSKTGVEDPEIRIVCHLGFAEIKEVLSREDYRDETLFGTEGGPYWRARLETGNFACVEFLR